MKKLVRDRIPEIIKQNKKVPVTHIASDEEYWKMLKEKLKEEVKEYSQHENEEEIADIFEIVYAICDFKKYNREELEQLRKKKAKGRGSFKKRIILDKIK